MSHQSPCRRSLWRLGEIMLQKEWIDWRQLAEALKAQPVQRELLGEILIGRRNIDRRQLMRALAIQCNIPYVDLSGLLIDEGALKAVPRRLAERYRFFPVEKNEHTLTVAVANPFNHFIKALMHEVSGVDDICFAIAMPEDIEEALRRHYSSSVFNAA